MAAKFRIACHAIQWRGEQNENPEKVIKTVADAGYDGIEGMKIDSPQELVHIASLCAKCGIQLVNAGGPDPIERVKYNATLGNKACETPAARRGEFGGEAPTDDDFKRAADSLAEACAAAKTYGLKAFHHAHLNTLIETPAEAEKLLGYAPDLYLLFDTGHMLAANSNPLDVFKTLSDRIAHVHIKDATAKDPATYKRWECKFGEDAWFEELDKGNLGFDGPAIFQGLEEIGYDLWVSVEQDRCTHHDPEETAYVNREYIRSLGY